VEHQPADRVITYNQAVQLYDANRLEEAREAFEAIVAQEPLNTAALIGLGMTHWRGEAFSEARKFLDEVLRLKPADEAAIRGLCLTLLSLGELEEAEKLVAQAGSPASWSHQTKLAVGLVKQGLRKWEESAWWYEQALVMEPRYAEAHNNLGVVRQELGDHLSARESFITSIVVNPRGVDAYRNLALEAQRDGHTDDAIILLRRALSNAPLSALLWNDLGKIYQSLGDAVRATKAFEESLRLDPLSSEAISSLSLLMYHEGYSERARFFCDRLIETRPPNVGAQFRKAISIPAIMDSHSAITETREKLARELDALEDTQGVIHDPLREVNVSNFYLAYHGQNERALQSRLATLFRAKTPMLHYTAPHIGRARRGKLRVGVCSRHWGAHTIGVLFAELFARLNSDDFELTCFHTATTPAALSPHFAAQGHSVARLPMDIQQARSVVAERQLDVMMYPDIGMEPFTYFMAFSRLAHRQIVMWGHPLTTGIPTIDFFLSSRALEVEEAQNHYSEKLVCFEHLNTFYRRPTRDERYDRGYFGFQPRRTLYVCPQTLFKLHPDFDPIISQILNRDPNGELVLIEGAHAGHTELIRRRFERTLSDVIGRIRFLRRLSHAEYLGLVAIADVMLDPPHFGGGSTSLQALSFGTPVVTMPSEFLRGRITAACYQAMRTDELIARDAAHYVDLVCDLGRNPEKRASVRGDLQARSHGMYENEATVAELAAFLRQEASAL